MLLLSYYFEIAVLLNKRCLLIYCYVAETVVSKSCVSTGTKSCGGCCEIEGLDWYCSVSSKLDKGRLWIVVNGKKVMIVDGVVGGGL